MKLRHLLTTFILFVSLHGFSQDSTEPQESTSQSTTEATTSQKVILFGMTAAGVILIGLGLRNSKFFRKK